MILRNRCTRIQLVAASVAAIFALVGCGGPAEPESAPSAAPAPAASASSTPEASRTGCTVAAGAQSQVLKNLDAIKVTGKVGEVPKLAAPAPFTVADTQVKVLQQGKGAKVTQTAPVDVTYYGVNARSCEVFDSSFGKPPVTFELDKVVAGFAKGLVGQNQGSRVLVAIPGKDGYDASGGRPPAIQKGDTLVFVIDINSVALTKPEGEPVAPKAGLPTVASHNDKLTVTVLKTDPPKELVVQPLIKGTGQQVGKDDTIVANYQEVSWKTGKVISQSYGQAPLNGKLSRLIRGWAEGIPGHTVGSRLLIVAPPDFAYPDGRKTPTIDKGDTVVYVVDILSAKAE